MGIKQLGPRLFSTFASRPKTIFVPGRSLGRFSPWASPLGSVSVPDIPDLLAADGCMDSLRSRGGCDAAGASRLV